MAEQEKIEVREFQKLTFILPRVGARLAGWMGGWLEEWKIMLKSASATTGTVLSLAISQPTKFQSLLIIITLKRLKILKKSNYSCHSFSIHALEFCFRIITLS